MYSEKQQKQNAIDLSQCVSAFYRRDAPADFHNSHISDYAKSYKVSPLKGQLTGEDYAHLAEACFQVFRSTSAARTWSLLLEVCAFLWFDSNSDGLGRHQLRTAKPTQTPSSRSYAAQREVPTLLGTKRCTLGTLDLQAALA